jgi:microcin C transport system substrate-binding protein
MLRPEVFEAVETPPASDGSGQDRKLLRQASQLLDEAGWKPEGTLRRSDKGEVLKVELLFDSPIFERIAGPYVKNLQLLGVDASIRTVDSAQYLDRQEHYDYDVISSRFMAGLTPGDGLRIFFGSASANRPGTYNMSGIASPAIDALIDKVVEAKTRDELYTAGRALDRVLRAEHFWVPNWHNDSYWIAYWDKFGRPAIKPKYDTGIIDTWWYDAGKAAQLMKAN